MTQTSEICTKMSDFRPVTIKPDVHSTGHLMCPGICPLMNLIYQVFCTTVGNLDLKTAGLSLSCWEFNPRKFMEL